MKVNEIEFNGKIYRIVKASDASICETCALKDHCDNTTQEGDEIYQICQSHSFIAQFKEIKNIVNIKENIKFYKFSTGAVFNVDHINRIITIGEIKHYEDGDYSFLITTADWSVHILNKSKSALSRERNKFIKFIEEYGN